MDQHDNALAELLKQLTEITPTVYYFYYDPLTGNIFHMRNYFEVDKLPHIVVPKDSVENDIKIDDYQILEKNGTFQLVKKEKLVNNIVKIDDNIHQIKKLLADPNKKISQINYQFDLLIEQDTIKQEFRIRLSGAIKDQLRLDTKTNQNIICYVTEENDPNILFRSLDIPLSKLLQYHYYTIPYDDYDGIPCNIFSLKYFENYLHLVIE